MKLIWTAAYLGAVFSVAGIYDQVTKRIPSRLRADQAPETKFGVDRADNFGSQGRAYGVDIIFVHGLGSNPDTTWGPRRRRDRDTAAAQTTSDSSGKACWVSDFLPEDIPVLFRKDIRIFFYNYDSYWKRDAVQTRLWNIGKSLLDRVATEIRSTEEERMRNLVFVGHSYGGLVIKRALIQASTSQLFADIAEHTRAIFFLGTPHRGSSFSRWGSIAARALQPLGSNPLLLQEVVYDSESLLDLHREFVESSKDKLRVVNFFEARKTRLIKAWFIQWEEFCVREQSATYDGVNIENIELPVDHYGLNKFESKNENYDIILRKLLEIVTPIALRRRQQVYSVPVKTVESYTERPRLSLAVAEKLHIHHEKSSVPHVLAIHGLGGTGKTQLALKYVEDYKDKYNTILWIDAKDETSVRSSFERCASELQLVVDRAQAQGPALFDSPTVQAVRKWLRDRKYTDDAWLVVIDNADDVSWGIKTVLPEGSQGSIIITSQDSQSRKLVSGGCEELRVDTMEPLEARALLLQHLQWSPGSMTEELQKACDMVAERLGYLALAVDLAGAYVGNDADREFTLRQYLSDYDRHQDDLLQSDYFRGLSATDKTVWTVWDTTLEKLERRSTELQPGLLLAFLARFSGGVVQDELFRLASLAISTVRKELYDGAIQLPSWLNRILTADGEEWDSYYYRQSRDLLVRYSLLQRIEGEWPGVAMHGLVQWRVKKYQQDQLWDNWHLMTILAGCAQLSKEEARPQYRRHILAHIPQVDRIYLDMLEVHEKRKAFAWHTIGNVYYYEGRWKEAEELFAQVMETFKRVLGEEHPNTLASMAYLASTYMNQGRWKEAEELEVQVIETRKRVFGEEHPDTLTSMANLASTFWNQGRWKEAKELFVQVIETFKRVLGEEHPDTLTSIANLASTYISQGRWKEAEELFMQVIETRKRVLGEEHPDTLTSIDNLASTYRN